MDYLLICFAALFGSGLTLFSGFGLGTILLPVFSLFFPPEIAVALTAVVHFLNNLFKLALLGRMGDWNVVLRFGVPAILAAVAGAWCLDLIADLPVIYEYELLGKINRVEWVKVCIGGLIAFFALFELVPRLKNINLSKKYLPVGGVLSGFFGGISGHQGALRTVFLIKAGLSKEAFIATGVIIACMVDAGRLAKYSGLLADLSGIGEPGILIAATVSAFAGAVIGKTLMKKITMDFVQNLVGGMLILMAIGMASGIIGK